MADARKSADFLSVAPLIPTGTSLAASLEFYEKELGFSVLWRSDTGAGIRRGNVVFNLVQNDNRDWTANCSVSIGVADVDALYAEYRNVRARVGPLEMKSWGRREFHMIVPSGVCLQFYTQSD